MRVAAMAVAVTILATATPARADDDALAYGPSLGPPRVRSLDPAARGDATGTAPSITLFEPLRLTLSSIAPATARAEGLPCEPDVTAVRGLAAERAAAFFLGRRLAIVGFGREGLGCPTDAAIGGGLVHFVPIRPNIFLVTSAGLVSQPQPHGNVGGAASVDLVFRRNDGRSWNVGVAVKRGVPTLQLGGLL